MTRGDPRARLLLAILAALAALQAFGLLRTPELASTAVDDPLSRILGSAKEALGDLAFLKADVYMHGGVTRHFEHDDKGGAVADDHEPASRGGWIAKLHRKVAFEGHYHVTGEGEKEILPFLSWAVSLDPHNEAAVLTTAYWLDRRFGKTDDAIAVLKKGSRDNPDAWEIDYELGKLLFKKKEDFRGAAASFESAIAKAGPGDIASVRLREIYYYLGVSEEISGNDAAALDAFRRALGFFEEGEAAPFKAKVAKRIRLLEDRLARSP